MYSSSRRSLVAVLRPFPPGCLTVAACTLSSATAHSLATGSSSPIQRGATCSAKEQPESGIQTEERPKGSLYGRPLSQGPFNAAISSATPCWNLSPRFSSVRYEATIAKEELPGPSGEKFQYQAEVSRLLDLIVHSLYSHKEVFLRELVSNASDALDKFRYLSVTDPSLLTTGSDLEVKVKTDPENGILTITDTGIGMTKDELVESLGTIAQSGTAKFLKALKQESKDKAVSDNSLIGQFGVGFYSAFLVAQKIVVSTKNPKSDKQYVWEGEADSSSFTIREETDPEKLLARGTSITLFLKKDAKHEYSDPTRVLNLVKNYSQFITFPIYVWLEKTREVEPADDSDKESSKMEGDSGEGKKKMKKKFVTEKYFTWELANETKPIWMRSPKEVSKEEYEDFYKKTFKEFLEPVSYSHFTTEGEIEFKSILYVPGLAPFSPEEMLSPTVKNIRLYVKRVFISDQFDNELFPRYLGFIKGVVDSNDLPLNVSREILQESRVVRLMKKRLMRKAFDMIEDIAKRENEEDYKTFWSNFGKYIKLGCIEDSDNHKRLAPLLRFHTSKHGDALISLKEYVQNMKQDQKSIYFLAADTIKGARATPFLEEFSKRDLEVLFLTDPIDEVAIGNLKSFQGKTFDDITKEDLDLGKDETKEELQEELSHLCEWMKKKLVGKVGKVQLSKRSLSYPCVLVTGKSGLSANMERILKAQTFMSDMGDMMDTMRETRTLEINPNHSVIKDLNVVCKDDSSNSYASEMMELLYETALLSTGYTLEEPAIFGRRVFEMMATSMSKQAEQKGVGASSEPNTASMTGMKDL